MSETATEKMTTETTEAHVIDAPLLLRLAREATGLSRKEVANRIKIPESAIAQFENGIPLEKQEDVYSKIYLKAYTKFLTIDHQFSFSDLRRATQESSPTPQSISAAASRGKNTLGPMHPKTSISRLHFIGLPQLIRMALVSLAVVSVALYLVFELKHIFAPPTVSLIAPQDGYSTTDTRITLEGKTDPEVLLRINGKDLSPDSTGVFRDTVDLQEGLNMVKIIARKKYSDTTEVTRRIFVQPKTNPTAEKPSVSTVP